MAKTIKLDNLAERINYYLANSPDDATEARAVVASLLEWALLERDAYGGFSYLQIEFEDNTAKKFGEEIKVKTFGDETRRHYRVMN